MISQTTRKRYADEIDQAKYGGLNDRQRDILWTALSHCTEPQIRRAMNNQAERDRFSFENLLADLRIAAQANEGDSPDKPYHPPNCSGGCEGEGWVPGPGEQAELMAAGETVRLARCPAGPEMTQAIWDGIRGFHEQWADSGRHRDVHGLIEATKLTNRLPDKDPT